MNYVLLLCALAFLFGQIHEPKGYGKGLQFNRLHGRYRVLYPDGFYSQPFCLDVATSYAEMNNGVVVPLVG